MSVVPPQPVY